MSSELILLQFHNMQVAVEHAKVSRMATRNWEFNECSLRYQYKKKNKIWDTINKNVRLGFTNKHQINIILVDSMD